jgi:murein DD-endopeptidase MepM/ murein hydrolase activator NlpD
MPKIRLLTAIILLFITGCAPRTTELPASTATSLPPTSTFTPTKTLTSTPTVLPSPTATPDPSAGFTLASPLQDLTLSELSEIISQPFGAPAPGYDDAHHGVDFAYYARGTHPKMEGLEIYSLLSGKVAGVTINRQRYGNMIIIETPLDHLPPQFRELLQIPITATPYPYNPRLGDDCATLQNANWSAAIDSIYILYGHMQNPPTLKVGDVVHAGDLIGQVGNTGASGNPHLHLEMRWGPGGTIFASMSHYDSGATSAERLEWCNWRISGMYVLLDPMQFINQWLQNQPGS